MVEAVRSRVSALPAVGGDIQTGLSVAAGGEDRLCLSSGDVLKCVSESNLDKLYDLPQRIQDDLLCFGVISKVDAPPLGISPIGCVPKRGGKFRLILDLRHLNNYCVPPVFRYEDIGTVCDFVEYNDDLISADIKNGFYHIPVREQDRTYLGFHIRIVIVSGSSHPMNTYRRVSMKY